MDEPIIKTEYKDLIIIVIDRQKYCDYEIQFPNGNKAHELQFETSLNALNEAKAKIDRQHNPCSSPGCQSRHTTACFYPDNETGEPNGYYCYEHSDSNGFCFGCGRFWGGVESFEFGDGYCEDCANDESQEDWDDWDDE